MEIANSVSGVIKSDVFHYLENFNEKYKDEVDIWNNVILKKDKKLLKELLKSKNYDINIKDNDGNTLLHKVVSQDLYDFALMLVNGGAKVDIYNNKGYMPIHVAAYEGNPECFALLIKDMDKLTKDSKKELVKDIVKRRLVSKNEIGLYKIDDYEEILVIIDRHIKRKG